MVGCTSAGSVAVQLGVASDAVFGDGNIRADFDLTLVSEQSAAMDSDILARLGQCLRLSFSQYLAVFGSIASGVDSDRLARCIRNSRLVTSG